MCKKQDGFLDKGILIKAPISVSVSLYCDSTEIEKHSINTAGDTVKHYFLPDKSINGTFWFKAWGEGFYTLQKDINYIPETLNVIEYTPKKRKENGYEPAVLNEMTDDFIKNHLTVNPLWKQKYPLVYTTPTVASKTKAAHEFTSVSEAEEYLSHLSGKYRRYHIADTEMGNRLSLFVFSKSDLSTADNCKTAAELLKANGKPTLMYMAQIHGNEPAGGDCALAIIKALDGSYGEKITEKLNVIVIPRVNPDGSALFTRYNPTLKIDMNRDYIKVKSREVAAVLGVYNAFAPEAVIDSHEYFKDLHSSSGSFADVLLGVGSGCNLDSHLNDCGTDITLSVIETLNAEGFCATYYPASENAGSVRGEYMVNTANYSSGRGYFALRGSVSILAESFGMNYGKQGYERRVVSQYITVTSLMEGLCKNAEKVSLAVKNARESITKFGAYFDKSRIFTLLSGSSFKDYREVLNPCYNLLSGEKTDKVRKSKCYFYDKPERSRPQATAYVIPKSTENIKEVLRLAECHNTEYYELPENTVLPLKQYLSSKDENGRQAVKLSDEKAVCFKSGAYVFCCSQPAGTLLMYLFEPDIDDTAAFSSGLCQNGTLSACDIYRFEQNLSNGKINEIK